VSRLSTALSDAERKAGNLVGGGDVGRAQALPRLPKSVRLLSFSELHSLKGIRFSRQWIAELIKRGRFPKPCKPGGGHASAWFEDEVDAFLENLRVERDDQVAA
jgi:predicted DNA-binding transcriptional regulator AlpA